MVKAAAGRVCFCESSARGGVKTALMLSPSGLKHAALEAASGFRMAISDLNVFVRGGPRLQDLCETYI